LYDILHNFFRQSDGYNFDNMATSLLVDVLKVRGTGSLTQELQVRDYSSEYFVGPRVALF
jgi:hypothetical protein